MFPFEMRIKVKSLAAESAIIKKDEKAYLNAARKHKDPYRKGKAFGVYEALSEHRRHVVRRAARETLLAYGYLRGRDYRRIESKAHHHPRWESVYAMVKRYGSREQLRDFPNWIAEEHEEVSLMLRARHNTSG